jgi:hypothetical protein
LCGDISAGLTSSYSLVDKNDTSIFPALSLSLRSIPSRISAYKQQYIRALCPHKCHTDISFKFPDPQNTDMFSNTGEPSVQGERGKEEIDIPRP